jgi:hypothetical protein
LRNPSRSEADRPRSNKAARALVAPKPRRTSPKPRDDALVWPEFGNVEDKTLTW